MKSCKLILFDLDDTLVFFDEYWAESSKFALAAHPLAKGLDPDRLYAEFKKLDLALEPLYLDEQITLTAFREQRFIGALAAFHVAATKEDAGVYDELFRPAIRKHLRPNEERLSFMEKLSGSYLLGIVTNGTLRLQMDKLEGAGLAPFFPEDSLFCSDTIGHSKPHAPIYEAALRHFGATPEETLFVGDSWENDVVGPSLLGMKTVWLNRSGLPAPESLAKPLAIIRNVTELHDDLF
ncbi:HAD family hydrolase [Paenibacillus sp. MBLB4367]|uniref:HAD family hydrolase n=1 Tax=Paenibacillus sp. MBLB4367 TaxID=3384767 RepID=UPI003907EEEC